MFDCQPDTTTDAAPVRSRPWQTALMLKQSKQRTANRNNAARPGPITTSLTCLRCALERLSRAEGEVLL